MTKLLTSLAIATAIVATPALAQKTPGAQIVTVDTQRIFSECTACKAASAALQGQVTSLQQRQQQLSAPLQTEANAIQTAGKALNGKPADAALQARATAFEAKQEAARTELAQREQAIQRNRAYIGQQINTKLGPIFQSVMAARGANLMVDSNTTLAASSTLDATNDVLAQLNQQLPSVSATAPAAPAASGR